MKNIAWNNVKEKNVNGMKDQNGGNNHILHSRVPRKRLNY